MNRENPSPDGDYRLLADERCVGVACDTDIVVARQHARDLAEQLGFSSGEATMVATAVSELARNIVDYAKTGRVTLRPVECGARRGLVVIAEDTGPGISDLEMAMRDGFSTNGRLGLGLPGVRRLMDEFEIWSEFGRGTRVTAKKWTP
jgi:serine/threonine-protein kinase RsbT